MVGANRHKDNTNYIPGAVFVKAKTGRAVNRLSGRTSLSFNKGGTACKKPRPFFGDVVFLYFHLGGI